MKPVFSLESILKALVAHAFVKKTVKPYCTHLLKQPWFFFSALFSVLLFIALSLFILLGLCDFCSFLWFLHVFLQCVKKIFWFAMKITWKGRQRAPWKLAVGAQCPGCDNTAAEDLRSQSGSDGSDAWEAFCITALDSYTNDLAPELALSVAWMSKTRKKP